jgi:hypothetical protein
VVGLALSDYLADRRGLVKPYQPKRRPTDAADAQGPNGDGTGVEDLEGANEERPGPVKALTWKALTWKALTWKALTWKALTWKALTWKALTWKALTWKAPTRNGPAGRLGWGGLAPDDSNGEGSAEEGTHGRRMGRRRRRLKGGRGPLRLRVVRGGT